MSINRLDLHITAIDTLMFRDGRPFNQNDAGASEAASVFPPFPPTLVGAIRAAMWQQLGGNWDKNESKLGDGTNWQDKKNILGPLSFGPPVLLKNEQPIFPVPLHVLVGKDGNSKEHFTFLKPSEKTFQCDLGEKKLPVPVDGDLVGIKSVTDRWITKAGLKKILAGQLPDAGDFVDRTDLWQTEPRVGIGIDSDTRTTSDGRLYMVSHVRMADDVSLAVAVDGWENGFLNSLRPLAGEHRMAELSNANAVVLPKSGTTTNDYCIIALSPVVTNSDGNIMGIDENHIESACIGKPVVIGGWDSKNQTPIPLKQCIPAGSVWYMSGDASSQKETIGKANEWGFGHVLVGKRPN